jgi:hypothetical protein
VHYSGVTLLVFKLATRVDTDYATRHEATSSVVGQPKISRIGKYILRLTSRIQNHYGAIEARTEGANILQEEIDRLSPDFIDVQKRATTIAKRTLRNAAVGASILALVLSWGFNWFEKRFEGIDGVKQDVMKLQSANNRLGEDLITTKAQLEKQIALEGRIERIEQAEKLRETGR